MKNVKNKPAANADGPAATTGRGRRLPPRGTEKNAPRTGQASSATTFTSRILDHSGVGLSELTRLLSWRAACRIGRMLGTVLYYVAPGKRARARTNLVLAGAPRPDRSVRDACRLAGQGLMEMLWLIARPPEKGLGRVRVEGLDALREAVDLGRGVLLVSGHAGNWELIALAAGALDTPVAVVAEPMRTPRLEQRITRFRARGGVRTLARGASGIAAARWLLRGGVLGCMMDRSRFPDRMLVPFLGQGTRVPLGPARLACMAGAAVVVGFASRQACGDSSVKFRRLESGPTKDPVELARSIAGALEEDVRSYPEQWFWIHRRQPNPDLPEAASTLAGSRRAAN